MIDGSTQSGGMIQEIIDEKIFGNKKYKEYSI